MLSGTSKAYTMCSSAMRRELGMSASDSLPKNSNKRGRSYTPRRPKPAQNSMKDASQKKEFQLRMTYESDVIRMLNSCSSVEEVEHVLRDSVVLSDMFLLSGDQPEIYHDEEDDYLWSNVKLDLDLILTQKLILSPKIAAKALRKLVELSLKLPPFASVDKHHRFTRINRQQNTIKSKNLLSILIESVATSIIQHTNDVSPTSISADMFNVFSIVDILYSFAVIQTNRIKGNANFNNSNDSFANLARRLCQIAYHDEMFVRQAGGNRTCETLWAMAVLQLNDQIKFISFLAESLYQRRDLLGKYSAQSLATLLWSFARLKYVHLDFVKSYTRRIRKQSIRDEATASDICTIIWAVSSSLQCLERKTALTHSQIEFAPYADELREETRGLIFRLTRPFLTVIQSTDDGTLYTTGNKSFVSTLHSGQIADIYWGFNVLGQDVDDELFSVLNEKLLDDQCLSSCSVQSIARILSSFSSLRSIHPRVIRKLGTKFLHLVENDDLRYFKPKLLTQILKASIELMPGRNSSTENFFKATCHLFRPGGSNQNFRNQCDDSDLSMVTWCFAKARFVDNELLSSLMSMFLRKSIIDQCSASSASRMLWSVTSLLSIDSYKDNDYLRLQQFNLFSNLSPILLIKPLTPTDSSSVIWAMAKASYASDLGIFDHLTEFLASDEVRMQKLSAKQLSQSVWACGKMIAFEDPRVISDKSQESYTSLAYVESASIITAHLSERCDDMTPKDIAQVIWAVARLHNEKSSTNLTPFLSVIVKWSDSYNAQEVSNILWALSKINVEDKLIETVVEALRIRLLNPDVVVNMNAQEASNVLYACAKMSIDDTSIFSTLSEVLMEQVNFATSQAIVNAMWAHEQVGLSPPQGLLDSWAEQKLGIITHIE